MTAKPIGGDWQYNDMQMPPFMPGRNVDMSDEEWAQAVGGNRCMEEKDGWKPSDVSGQRFKKVYHV
jgi:hypothetical protein